MRVVRYGYCIATPWLTTSDCPVSALLSKPARNKVTAGDILDRGELAIDGLTQHHVLDHLLFGDAEALGLFGDLLVDQRRAHEAWADHIGADAMLGAFLGDRLRQADQAMLGGDVRRLQLGGFLGVDRAHIDETAAIAELIHMPQRRPRGQEGTVEMDRQQQLPFAVIELIHRFDDLVAGIADHDIQATEMGSDRIDAGIDLRLIGDIHLHRHRGIGAVQGVDLRHRGVGDLAVKIGDRHFRAFADEGQGDFLADAAGSAGDDGNFIFHAHLGLFLSC